MVNRAFGLQISMSRLKDLEWSEKANLWKTSFLLY
jgi:hypothetical protein